MTQFNTVQAELHHWPEPETDRVSMIIELDPGLYTRICELLSANPRLQRNALIDGLIASGLRQERRSTQSAHRSTGCWTEAIALSEVG